MLHTKHEILEAVASRGIHRQGLFLKALGTHGDFICGSHFDANGEITARIGNGFPSGFFFGGAANAHLRTGQRQTLFGKDGAADEKIIGVARSGSSGLLF